MEPLGDSWKRFFLEVLSEFDSFLDNVDKINSHLDFGNDSKIETENFHTFVDCMRLQKDKELPELINHFLKQDGLLNFVLEQRDFDKKLCNNFVKLHDIWANFTYTNGSMYDRDHGISVEFVVRKVLFTLITAQAIFHLSTKGHLDFLAEAVGIAMVNFEPIYPDEVDKYVKCLKKLCTTFPDKVQNCQTLVNSFSLSSHHEAFVKAVIHHSPSGYDILSVLGEVSCNKGQELHMKLLLSPKSYCKGFFTRHICYLKRSMNEELFASTLDKIMTLWADPVIAKAHVTNEVIHYTNLILQIFCHMEEGHALKNQTKISLQLAKGLPNHFNSVDFRTVGLAKFLCEILTESLQRYSKTSNEKSDFNLNEYVSDDLPCGVLRTFVSCCSITDKFWLKEQISASLSFESITTLSLKSPKESVQGKDCVDSDDDDDDLEPIESNHIDHNPEIKVTINYIRDFLDNREDIKTYEEVEHALKRLPLIINNQLKFEHPSLSKEILDSMFSWENDFEQPVLDQYRHRSLCSIIKSTDKNAVTEHFCMLFHNRGTQPYKQSLILDVLSTVSKEVPLKQLIDISKCAFNIILNDECSIQKADVTVKIPMVLFFSRLLGNTLPKECVEESMVISYLNCLKQLDITDDNKGGNSSSAALEQTVRYAVYNLNDVLTRLQFKNQSVAISSLQTSISDTKSWLMKLQRTQLDSLSTQ